MSLPATRSRRLFARAVTACLAAAALATGVAVCGAAPAQAAEPAQPFGTVATTAGLNKRAYPSTDASVKGVLPPGARIGLVCQVRAMDIAGNNLWYLVRDSHQVWIPARYVVATGSVKYCKDVARAHPGSA